MVDAQAPEPLPSMANTPSTAERELLRSLLQQLATRVRREQLETWFRSLDVRRADAQEIELSVTSQFVRDWLQKNFLGVLQDSVAALNLADAGIANAGTRPRLVLSHRDEDGWDGLRWAQPTAASDEVDRLLRTRDVRTPPAPTGSVPDRKSVV